MHHEYRTRHMFICHFHNFIRSNLKILLIIHTFMYNVLKALIWIWRSYVQLLKPSSHASMCILRACLVCGIDHRNVILMFGMGLFLGIPISLQREIPISLKNERNSYSNGNRLDFLKKHNYFLFSIQFLFFSKKKKKKVKNRNPPPP
jgi:hypothetical protein